MQHIGEMLAGPIGAITGGSLVYNAPAPYISTPVTVRHQLHEAPGEARLPLRYAPTMPDGPTLFGIAAAVLLVLAWWAGRTNFRYTVLQPAPGPVR